MLFIIQNTRQGCFRVAPKILTVLFCSNVKQSLLQWTLKQQFSSDQTLKEKMKSGIKLKPYGKKN